MAGLCAIDRVARLQVHYPQAKGLVNNEEGLKFKMKNDSGKQILAVRRKYCNLFYGEIEVCYCPICDQNFTCFLI